MSQVVSVVRQQTCTATEQVALGGASGPVAPSVSGTLKLANGSGSGQVNQHFEDNQVTLAASASKTYVLSALTDAQGRTVALTKLRTWDLVVTGRTSGDGLAVGGAATHPMVMGWGTGAYTVYDQAGDGSGQGDGYPVAAGSADQLEITNSGSNPITYNFGVSGV